MHAKEVVELRADGDHRVERIKGALQDHRNLGPPQVAQLMQARREQVDRAGRPVTADRLRMEEDLAGTDHSRRSQQTDGGERERGLAAAAFAGQAEDLAAAKHEVAIHHRVDCLVPDAVIDA